MSRSGDLLVALIFTEGLCSHVSLMLLVCHASWSSLSSSLGLFKRDVCCFFLIRELDEIGTCVFVSAAFHSKVGWRHHVRAVHNYMWNAELSEHICEQA